MMETDVSEIGYSGFRVVVVVHVAFTLSPAYSSQTDRDQLQTRTVE